MPIDNGARMGVGFAHGVVTGLMHAMLVAVFYNQYSTRQLKLRYIRYGVDYMGLVAMPQFGSVIIATNCGYIAVYLLQFLQNVCATNIARMNDLVTVFDCIDDIRVNMAMGIGDNGDAGCFVAGGGHVKTSIMEKQDTILIALNHLLEKFKTEGFTSPRYSFIPFKLCFKRTTAISLALWAALLIACALWLYTRFRIKAGF
jgi:hypothetical protein